MPDPDPDPEPGAPPVPVLTDGVVALRGHRADDAPAVVEQCNDPVMTTFVPLPRPYGVEQAEQFLARARAGWADGSACSWAIDVPDVAALDGWVFGGSIDYRPRGDGTAEIGFGLHPAARGRGAAARAVRLVVGHAFDSGVRLLTWRAVVGNWASRRTAWACGFTVEGPQRGALAHPDGPKDAWVASLAAGEPRHPTAPWHVPPVLPAGARIVVRPWRDDDVVPVDHDADTAAFLPVAPTAADYPAWLAEARDDMARGRSVRWAIAADPTAAAHPPHSAGVTGPAEVTGTGPVLGGIHIVGLGHPRRPGGRVGYWVHPDARGRGRTLAALRAVVGHAFAPAARGGLGLHRLAADVDVANVPSQRILRAAGFVPCGVHEQEIVSDRPGHGDMLECQLLRQPGAPGRPWRLLRTPSLTDGVVTLEPFDEADLPAMALLLREPDGWPDGSPDADLDEAAAWLRRLRGAHAAGAAATWAIRRPEDSPAGSSARGAPVGTLRVFRLDDPGGEDAAEVGVWVRDADRRLGLAGRALRLLADHLLAPTAAGGAGLRRLTATTTPENAAAQAVLTRCRFARWGIDPHATPPGDPGRPPAPGAPRPTDRWRYVRMAPADGLGRRAARAGLDDGEAEEPGERVELPGELLPGVGSAGDAGLPVGLQDA